MGKHERKEVEQAEKIIVKILNSQAIGNLDKTNHWFNHALAVANQIKLGFPNIKKAFHLGSRYDNTGDILIISNGERIFIEIKMSDTKTGMGTKANISQDALTLNHLIEEKAQSGRYPEN